MQNMEGAMSSIDHRWIGVAVAIGASQFAAALGIWMAIFAGKSPQAKNPPRWDRVA
jgi:hypothetical protein